MADKKTELMAQFYAECQKKGYTNMTDSVHSLKAKVIATDLKLNYRNIVSFYEKAAVCYEQVQKEKVEAQKQRKLQQQKEEQERIRRRVDGELLVTLSDSSYESEKAMLVRVFIRPDNSVYYTINNGSKIEGVPEISVKQGGAVLLTYHPSQAVYTGATVGGITTGGVHHTKAGYTANKAYSGKGDIEISVSGRTFTLQLAKMSGRTCALFKRDGEFARLVHNGEIKCYVNSEKANLYYETIKTGRLDHQTMMNALSMAADEQRLTYSACECIANLLGRIVYGQFPPSDEQVYESAKTLENASTSNQLLRAINEFKKISDYNDAAKRAQTLEAKYEEILQAEKERAIIEKEERKKRNKKTAIIMTLGTFVVAAAILAFIQFGLPAIRYNTAKRMIENQQFEEAIIAFKEIEGYKDSTEQIRVAENVIAEMERAAELEAELEESYNNAIRLLESGISANENEAYYILNELGDYKDSEELVQGFCYSVISEVVQLVNASVPIETQYEYDSRGWLVNKKESDGDVYAYTYDSEGRIIREVLNEGTTDTEYSYYENGVRKRTLTKTRLGTVTTDFDMHGSPVKGVYTYFGFTWEFSYTYTEDGEIDVLDCLYRKNNAEYIQTFHLDEIGENLTLSCEPNNILPVFESRSSDGKEIEYIISYDYFDGIQLKENYTREYDSRGNLINEKQRVGNDGFDRSYSYDAKGNLIQITTTYLTGTKLQSDYSYGYIYVPDAK